MERVIHAVARPNYRLWLKYSDGVEGEVDPSALVGPNSRQGRGSALSPFAVLGFLHLRANRWPTVPRTTLYCVMLLVAFSSLAVYGLAVVRPLVSKPPAFLFVALPPVSLLLVAVGLAAAWIAGRSRHVESGR